MSAEQKARDMLERMGVENAQSFSSGELVELANLIANKAATTINKRVESIANPLIPCPFCGSSGAFLTDLWNQLDDGNIANVHCVKCGASGPLVYDEFSLDTAIQRARVAWNSR